jgi:Type I phosphodiesterase / nucleotide pyrophosphatase
MSNHSDRRLPWIGSSERCSHGENVGLATDETVAQGIHLFVLIDALGWTYLDGRDFLNDLLPNRQPLRTVLGFSSGAIPTILTGVPPAQNGHWNLFYYDPQHSPFRWLRHFRFLPDRLMNARVTRKVMKELGRRVLGLGPLFECCVNTTLLPFFNWTEKRNIYATGGITGAPSIFDQLAAARRPFHVYSYHQFTDAKALQQAVRDIKQRSTGFYFLYLSEMDSLLHHACDDPGKIDERLAFYTAALRKLYQSARAVDPDATLTIFSDHGMTPIRTHYDLAAQVESLELRMPDDYLAVYDSTMVRFWFFNEKAKQTIIDLLSSVPSGRILSEVELRGLGIYFPDHRHGEMVFLLHPGCLLSRSDFHGQWLPAGMHGYHPDDIYSDGIFLSNCPPPVEVRSIADVYHCMRIAAELPESQVIAVGHSHSRVG